MADIFPDTDTDADTDTQTTTTTPRRRRSIPISKPINIPITTSNERERIIPTSLLPPPPPLPPPFTRRTTYSSLPPSPNCNDDNDHNHDHDHDNDNNNNNNASLLHPLLTLHPSLIPSRRSSNEQSTGYDIHHPHPHPHPTNNNNISFPGAASNSNSLTDGEERGVTRFRARSLPPETVLADRARSRGGDGGGGGGDDDGDDGGGSGGSGVDGGNGVDGVTVNEVDEVEAYHDIEDDEFQKFGNDIRDSSEASDEEDEEGEGEGDYKNQPESQEMKFQSLIQSSPPTRLTARTSSTLPDIISSSSSSSSSSSLSSSRQQQRRHGRDSTIETIDSNLSLHDNESISLSEREQELQRELQREGERIEIPPPPDSLSFSINIKEQSSPTETKPHTRTPTRPPIQQVKSRKWSIWEMLLEDGEDEIVDGFRIDGKWDRITNFLAVPLSIEKITILGSMFCLDSMLYLFTILPIKVGYAWFTLWKDLLWYRRLRLLPTSQIQVILKMLLLVIPTVVLLFITDTSKMYHSVRGQDNIKLYVIFNVLEIGDRLCGAIGQDIMDTLFAKETLDPGPWRQASTDNEGSNSKRDLIRGRRRRRARPVFFFLLALAYVHVHAIVFLYQLVSLNVAINSYDNALLTLLVSNQFVEIKGSVFKKFEKENLFQITCADIVERFQLGLMLSVIAVRNMVEMAGSDFAFLPKSFIRGKSLIDTIWSPVLVVIMSEMVVDWVKHGFITKFNHIRTSCYERFADVLCKDIIVAGGFGRPSNASATGRRHASFADQSPLVNRRLGFAAIPLACLVVRVGAQGLAMIFTSLNADQDQVFTAIASATKSPAQIDALAFGLKVLKWTGFGLGVLIGWFCLVALKIALGIQLLRHASHRVAGMDRREVDDRVNDFGRSPVGDSQREKVYGKAVTEYLSRPQDDLPLYPPMIEVEASSLPTSKTAKPKWRLEEVERWTMIKRIF